MKNLKFIFLAVVVSTLGACSGCYETHEAAWQACDDKYNGKCRYLGKDFQVCKHDRY
jgi:hypothetical protein